MSDFEHFAAFFGNLTRWCRRHNGSWDPLSTRCSCGVALLDDGTLRHPDNDVAMSGAVETRSVYPAIAARALARYYAPRHAREETT